MNYGSTTLYLLPAMMMALSIITGCDAGQQYGSIHKTIPTDASNFVDYHNDKINAIRQTVRSLALEEVQDSKIRHDDLLDAYYFVSVEPKWSNGMMEASEGGDDLMGIGSPGNLALKYNKDTIDVAVTAVVSSAYRYKSGKISAQMELYFWRDNTWWSESEVGKELLKNMMK